MTIEELRAFLERIRRRIAGLPEETETKPATPLPFTTGIELTAVYGNHQELYGGTDPQTKEYVNIIARYLRRRNRRIITDGHCIEFPTKILRTWEETKRTFEQFRARCSSYNFHARHPATVCGGGHIHLGLKTKAAAIRFRNLVFSYPAIPWTFLHPCDTESGNNPTRIIWGGKDFGEPTVLEKDIIHSTKDYSVGAGGGSALSPKPGIVECRFFEAAENWEEQKLHLDFAYALATYATTSHNVHKQYICPTQRKLSRITRAQAIAMMRELCSLIDFDFARIQKQIKRNLYPRWWKGYQRT